MSCLCKTGGGQLLLQERYNLNVNARRLARCKIITVIVRIGYKV